MRRLACAAIALTFAAGGPAGAQTLAADDILNRAAYTLRIDTERLRIAPAGSVDERIDITLTRRWPGAVSFVSRGGVEFDVIPHAGLGVGSAGGQAEGGAMLTVSRSREERAIAQLRDMGVADGATLGDKGRWYLFAAASGRAVGLNMLRSESGGWDRAGWTTDPAGALVGDAHVGVGWRKGDMQSSFGVIHREVKGKHMVFGQQTRDDTVAAFTFSFRPQK